MDAVVGGGMVATPSGADRAALGAETALPRPQTNSPRVKHTRGGAQPLRRMDLIRGGTLT